MLRFLVILPIAAAASVAESAPDFNRDIRPILSNKCFQCHGPDENQRKGGTDGLRLDTAEGAGVDLGGYRAIVPGKPDVSEVMKRIVSDDADEKMPPRKSGKTISKADIEMIRHWIEGGATYARHWSYEKPVRPDVPDAVASWARLKTEGEANSATRAAWTGSRNGIDGFVLEGLSRVNLLPQIEADRRTLARRVCLDLTGLPPTPGEVDAFESDKNPDAYERYVDVQLAKPAFGEHWARMWLDLARYADSAGYADDPPRKIWAYRDYVIRAFNENMPFDRFTIEQLAGDLLPNPTNDQLTATAFHRNTMTNNEGGTNDEEFRNAAIVDRVNTTMAVWMGTSFACAQCHTHKYDPISQREYFRFFAVFNNTADADRNDESPTLGFYTDAQRKQRSEWEERLKALEEGFRNPKPEAVASAERWMKGFSGGIVWNVRIPAEAKSAAGTALGIEKDGAVLAARNDAKKDVYTVALPIDEPGRITALRLEALPAESLPGNGPGFDGGNFVVTRLRAEVQRPAAAPVPPVRFVRIELPGEKRILQLAEVQVFDGTENVAPQGEATQKSTYLDAAAKRAIDGNTAREYEKGSVSHTAEGADPWWEVDLKAVRKIGRIVIWNRAEIPERLNGFRVLALGENREVIWESSENAAQPESMVFELNGSRELSWGSASADFTQADFDEEATIRNGDAKGGRRLNRKAAQKGWAVGGAVGKPHQLIVTTLRPVDIVGGSKLVVTIEMQSPFPRTTLGHFRISTTNSDRVEEVAETPPEILNDLGNVTDGAARGRVIDYYVRSLAAETKPDREALQSLRSQLDAMKEETVPICRELPDGKHRKTHVQLRGNYLSLGEEVQPGLPSAFNPAPAGQPMNRLTVAKWLMDDNNPLTSRVVANRFWESIFGIGLVRTSEEFGAQGEMPSNGAMLDWLACELKSRKWDVKGFLKLLVTSQAYRQSSKVTAAALELDPENRLVSRGPRFRMSAEMIRDQALAVSGLLSAKMYGASVRPTRPSLGLSAAFGGGLDWQPSTGEDRFRRGIYTEWRRTSPYPSMVTFDATSREVCTLRRNRTNTPLQALVLLNDPVYVEAAQGLARRIVASAKEPEARVKAGYQFVLQREPNAAERSRVMALYADAKAYYSEDPKKAVAFATEPIGPAPAGIDMPDLAAWTTVANVLLNLDETLMKR